jgi:hypothetical protein
MYAKKVKSIWTIKNCMHKKHLKMEKGYRDELLVCKKNSGKK